MLSFMKVFHIFLICLNKCQQKCISTIENVEKLKSSSNCVFEDILEFHKMTTMDLENEHWNNENDSNIPLYLYLHIVYIISIYFI